MSGGCYPDSLINSIPNLYYYAANNPRCVWACSGSCVLENLQMLVRNAITEEGQSRIRLKLVIALHFGPTIEILKGPQQCAESTFKTLAVGLK